MKATCNATPTTVEARSACFGELVNLNPHYLQSEQRYSISTAPPKAERVIAKRWYMPLQLNVALHRDCMLIYAIISSIAHTRPMKIVSPETQSKSSGRWKSPSLKSSTSEFLHPASLHLHPAFLHYHLHLHPVPFHPVSLKLRRYDLQIIMRLPYIHGPSIYTWAYADGPAAE